MTSALSVVAGALRRAACREGLEPPAALGLPDGAGTVEVGGPADLGVVFEGGLGPEKRTETGTWFTPERIAHRLVCMAGVDAGVRDVLDPACGGGVFLLAALDALVAAGVDPADAVARIHGRDTSEECVTVTRSAIWWWAARHGVDAVPNPDVRCGDGLLDDLPPSDVVVGNPPFLGQLRARTARTEGRRAELSAQFAGVLHAYTDEAWLFLLAAVRAARPGGRVALVQPQSLLGARDAGPVRAAVDEVARLEDLWVDDGTTFDASVDACAPVLRIGTGGSNDWAAALADAHGVPPVVLPEGPTIGELATVHAGFRDEFYGIAAALREGGPGLRVVTAGAIDPFGVRPEHVQRIAKQRWRQPTVDPAALEGKAARWVQAQSAPKVLVATQTRVLEAAGDPVGALVGSVPVVAVVPHDPADLWHLLAALHAPAVSAWMLRRSAGTALSADACKPTKALLSAVPAPTDRAAWDEAADHARRLASGAGDLAAFAVAADAAHGVHDASVGDWWLRRLPVRSRR